MLNGLLVAMDERRAIMRGGSSDVLTDGTATAIDERRALRALRPPLTVDANGSHTERGDETEESGDASAVAP